MKPQLSPHLLKIAVDVVHLSPVAVGRVPYTKHFPILKQEFTRLAGCPIEDDQVRQYLIGARKRGMASLR